MLFFLESNEILSSYKTTSSTVTPERKKRRFELEEVSADEVTTKIAGSGSVELSGRSVSQNISIAGSGDHRAAEPPQIFLLLPHILPGKEAF